jgi:hypothetical protein
MASALQPTHVDHPSRGHELAMSWVTALATADDRFFVVGPKYREVSAEFTTNAASHMLEVPGLPSVKPDQSLVVVGVEYYLQLQQLAQEFPAIQVAAARLLRLPALRYNLRFLACTEVESHEIRRRIERALLRTFDSRRAAKASVASLAPIANLLSTASELPDIDVAVRRYVYEVDRGRHQMAGRIRQHFEAFNPGLRDQFESAIAVPVTSASRNAPRTKSEGLASSSPARRQPKGGLGPSLWQREVLRTLHHAGFSGSRAKGTKVRRLSRTRFALIKNGKTVGLFEIGQRGELGRPIDLPLLGPALFSKKVRRAGRTNKIYEEMIVRTVREPARPFKDNKSNAEISKVVVNRSRDGEVA